jgi:pentatricopeptide repeat protein
MLVTAVGCRRLQTAASEGNIDGAESVFASMEAAGLVPGPRAFHVLLCAFLKGGDTSGALGVAGRATEAGVWAISSTALRFCI